MNIVLVGMPGAGKSAVGKLLSQMTGRKFSDTDEEIATRFGPIPQFFREKGEDFFRAEEKKLCHRLSKEDGLVIATGGGTVLDAENISLLKENGRIVYLRATEKTLLTRLGAAEDRPLLAGSVEKNLSSMMKARAAVYEGAADLTVDTDGRTPFEVAKIISEAIA